jgi:hypothetical protein
MIQSILEKKRIAVKNFEGLITNFITITVEQLHEIFNSLTSEYTLSKQEFLAKFHDHLAYL